MTVTTHELLVAARPVNKTAALHTAGGDRTGAEELRWTQREVFDTTMAQITVENMLSDIRKRAELEAAFRKLVTLEAKSNSRYYQDYHRHVQKLWYKAYPGRKLKMKKILKRLRRRETFTALPVQGVARQVAKAA